MSNSARERHARARALATGEPAPYSYRGIGRDNELFDAMTEQQARFRAHLAMHLLNCSDYHGQGMRIHSYDVVSSPQYDELTWFSPTPENVVATLASMDFPWRTLRAEATGGALLVDDITGGRMRVLSLKHPESRLVLRNAFEDRDRSCWSSHDPMALSSDSARLLAGLMSRYCIGYDLAAKVWPVKVDSPGWSTSFDIPPLNSDLSGSREIALTGSGDRWALSWDGTPHPSWLVGAMSSGPMGMPGLDLENQDGYVTFVYGRARLALLRRL